MGYKCLLVIVDLASDKFDIEPIKNKDSSTVLNAMKKIYARGILKQPYSSLKTDSGTEFKGVFHKWLWDNDIFHKVGSPNRHKALANVENLNRQLGEVIIG